MKADDYLKNLVCLYVEDDKNIRESFIFILNRYFKKILVAENGEKGLELYKKYKPDIVISDIRMPIMDGIEMAKRIKEFNPNTYIIFITAFSDVDYLREAIDLNVEGYLTKPIDKKLLIKKLNFLAKVIKNEKETKELLVILQILFEKQLEASILYENNIPKLINKKFQMLFGEMSLEELINKFNLDIKKEKQIVHIEDNYLRAYEVKILKIDSTYTMISFNDITDYEKEIFIDKLTGVFNRKYLDQILEKLIDKKVCMILGDIDFFKKVNDIYGHLKGDEILRIFADVLRNNLREKDKIIRMGGEEFLIILDDVIDSELSKKIAVSLKEEVEKKDFNGINITASFGVCCEKMENIEDFKNLYKKVDEALYKAKESGRNQVRVCEG